ncbi:DsbA family protein [Acidovorax sp. FG27]|uniref:DsbA family protein n=1 Tax=Acidovorax sp. FG27 TaxID=3133652 RepID=UPI0030E9838A
MTKTLHYLFDPLCGWCYGAGGTVAEIAALPGVSLRLLPSGLFAGTGARPMTADFADYAWNNDQRIERLTGQRFTEKYQRDVLGDLGQMFDSGPATLALTAVALTAPERELQALKAIQQARYVHGLDITQSHMLADALTQLGLGAAADRLARPDAALLDANRARIAQAQALSERFGARGVPAFVLEQSGQQQVLHSSAVFSNPQAFLAQVAGA